MGTFLLRGVDNVHGLMVSAYRNPDGKLVVVALNYGELADRTITLTVSDREGFLLLLILLLILRKIISAHWNLLPVAAYVKYQKGQLSLL